VIRLATWIVGSLLISVAVAWLISLPGTLTLEIAGYRMQPRVGVAVVLLAAIFAAAILLWTLIRNLLAAPRNIARRNRQKRREQGFDALSDGFIALQAGDAVRARELAQSARARLPDNAAAQLLQARADLALGDMPAAREHYRALISSDKTAVAALAGLYEQARTQNRPDTALTFARKAAELAPGTPWASAAVFDDLARRSQWDEALTMVEDEPANTREERTKKRRLMTVLQTALARELQLSKPLDALDHANAALKLSSEFVPASLIAAQIHINRGESRKAMSLLRRIWRTTEHPDAATLYINAQPGSSAVERLRRAQDIIFVPPTSQAGAAVLARAAIDAYDWALARDALERFSKGEPTQAICLLMAEIEEGENGDVGKAREWLARAVRAPRDPAWTADGMVSEEWEPISPITGKLDAFQWKVPVSAGRERTEALPGPQSQALALPQG
jgi:HemY protein